ncbi:HmuY family protein [Winogradskyella luteola]|uniref:HmuY family protein n=1 Tax=Winogradskyella luteola TaxID=2828330 RepID=A0A9X1F7C0_9FLAO|nr:HmuY family protein [Winogradskyella luteola]MBV7267783.1 HmuY family protein [Winogradskyella luteola]
MTNKFFILILFIAVALITSCSNDDDGPQGPIEVTIEGATLAPSVGGPNQGNQVYIDLSTSETTSVRRDSWDLGFYSGSDFRVVLNSAVYMAAAELNTTDIDAVNSSITEVSSIQPLVAVGTFQSESAAYVDNPNGDLSGTAIAPISATDDANKVYLVNLGDEIGTETPSTGNVDISDGPRGWMKIRILREGNDYVVQYADLDATTHNEVTISKNTDYNFTFFSLVNGSEVLVEPMKTEWDIVFTVFTNEITGFGPYGFADYVVNNIKNDAKVYMIDTEDEGTLAYEDFSIIDVNDTLFSNDRRVIGNSWRNGGGPGTLPSLKENVYYIINDANGNYYKLKFLAMFDTDGNRGYPQFEYSLLED